VKDSRFPPPAGRDDLAALDKAPKRAAHRALAESAVIGDLLHRRADLGAIGELPQRLMNLLRVIAPKHAAKRDGGEAAAAGKTR
jgi:hypothetical protein